jgi:hypothetical protein
MIIGDFMANALKNRESGIVTDIT